MKDGVEVKWENLTYIRIDKRKAWEKEMERRRRKNKEWSKIKQDLSKRLKSKRGGNK